MGKKQVNPRYNVVTTRLGGDEYWTLLKRVELYGETVAEFARTAILDRLKQTSVLPS